MSFSSKFIVQGSNFWENSKTDLKGIKTKLWALVSLENRVLRGSLKTKPQCNSYHQTNDQNRKSKVIQININRTKTYKSPQNQNH